MLNVCSGLFIIRKEAVVMGGTEGRGRVNYTHSVFSNTSLGFFGTLQCKICLYTLLVGFPVRRRFLLNKIQLFINLTPSNSDTAEKNTVERTLVVFIVIEGVLATNKAKMSRLHYSLRELVCQSSNMTRIIFIYYGIYIPNYITVSYLVYF